MPLYLKDKMVSGISLGVPGKSAYEQAKEGGYAGTEEEFAQILANAATTDYVDEAIGKIPTPDVSGQINTHNTDTGAHSDIRTAVSNAASAAATAQTTANGKANATHSHTISDVTNLQTTLDGKAASSHNHDAGNITSGVLPVERGGTGATSISALATSIGASKIATGEYTGNGQCRGDWDTYSKKLTFNFAPKLIVLWKKQLQSYEMVLSIEPVFGYVRSEREPLQSTGWSDDFGIFVPLESYSGNEARYSVAGTGSTYFVFGSNYVEWYSYNAAAMYNSSGYKYGYIAFG